MMSKQRVLKKSDIDKRLRSLSEWELNKSNSQLTRIFAFPTFISGLAFIAKVTVFAEVLQHHPDIELSYGSVKVKLTTHDVKGLTKADFELAKKIDDIRINT